MVRPVVRITITQTAYAAIKASSPSARTNRPRSETLLAALSSM